MCSEGRWGENPARSSITPGPPAPPAVEGPLDAGGESFPGKPTARPPRPTLDEIRRRYFGPLLAGLLLARLVSVIVWLALLVPYWPDVTFPEGALVARALDVAQGRTPYQDWRQWPHGFAPYPPLAYYPVGWLARAFTAGAPGAHAVAVTGRAFSLANLLGVFLLIYLLGRWLGLGRVWSLLAVSLMGESLQLMEFCTSYRPDAPRTFFALLALWIALRFRPSRAALGAVLASLYLSLWFKPTAWAPALILAGWTWRHWGSRRAAAVWSGFVAAGLIPLFALNHYWRGALLLNIVDSLRNGLTLREVFHLFRQADGMFLAVVALGVVVASGVLLAARRGDRPGRGAAGALPADATWFFAAIPLTVAIGLAQMLKVGAAMNYLMDSFTLAAVAAVWWIGRLWRGEARVGPRVREAALWLGLIPLLIFQGWNHFATLRDDFKGKTKFWDTPPIVRVVKGCPGPILTTNPFVALAAPAPTVMDYFQYSVLYRRGNLDAEPLLGRIRRGEIPLVVLSVHVLEEWHQSPQGGLPIFCDGLLPTLVQHYAIAGRVWPFVILRPLGPGEAPPPGGVEALFKEG